MSMLRELLDELTEQLGPPDEDMSSGRWLRRLCGTPALAVALLAGPPMLATVPLILPGRFRSGPAAAVTGP